VIKKLSRNEKRKKKHRRIRNKIMGSAERPRLNVYKSLKHMYAQIINDETGNTLVSASTLEDEVKEGLESTSNVEAAKKVGKIIAKRALAKGIDRVVFDRSGYIYHGRVKAVAEGAREGGLKF